MTRRKSGYPTDLRNWNMYIDYMDNNVSLKELAVIHGIHWHTVRSKINNLRDKIEFYQRNYKKSDIKNA